MTLIFAGTLAVLMGISLGLLGGGGSVLAVPILLYVVGMAEKEAIAASLLVVGATSAFVALQHWRKGNIEVKVGAVFGAFAMAGGFGGGMLAKFIPGGVLIAMFAGMMFIAGGMMLRGGRKEPAKTGEFSLGKAALEGVLVGAFTGLVGAGGGFMVVPALVLFGGLDMRRAVGTSTMVIAMKSFAAFAGHASHEHIDYEMAAFVTGFALVGSVVGARLVSVVPPDKLRGGFGVFILVTAVYLLGKQAPAGFFGTGLGYAAIAAVVLGFGALAATMLARRQRLQAS